MFYTEYRPQKFSDLINAKHIVSTITSALAKNKVPHAFFLTGSRGTGKTTTARLIAKALNCNNPVLETSKDHVHFEPCGKCESCKAIEQGNHLDVIEIDAASNRGIENIRQLRDNVTLSPSKGKTKVYIIDEVHMLTIDAANALLKTLEEPPKHAYFVMCTTNPEKVPDTIKSRCQQFQFARPSVNNIVEKLKLIAEDKNQKIEEEKLTKIAVLAKGAYREAETLLEQVINGDKFASLLLDREEDNYYDFILLLLSKDTAKAIELAHRVYYEGANIELWTERFVEYVRSLIFEKLGIEGVDKTFVIDGQEKKLAKRTDLQVFKDVIKRFNDALYDFKSAVVPTLPLELAIIDLCSKLPESGSVSQVSGNPAPEALSGKSTNLNKEKTNSHQNPDSSDSDSRKNSASEKVNAAESSVKTIEFPYEKLIQKVQPKNHSIHLLLRSCKFVNFDGHTLDILAYYSFHKERLMSNKTRMIIENAAKDLVGGDVVLRCKLSDKKPNAKTLTDRNVKPAKEDKLVSTFEKVFGEDVLDAV